MSDAWKASVPEFPGRMMAGDFFMLECRMLAKSEYPGSKLQDRSSI